MAEHICYFWGPLDQHCVTLPCHCPCLSSVCTGWLGKAHLGTNLASRRFSAVVPAQPKSLWLQWVGDGWQGPDVTGRDG